MALKRFSQRGGHSTMAELNVTPMLDLVFVLLIIFIITTPMLEQQLPMKLPTATALPSSDLSGVKMVDIDAAGTMSVNKQTVDAAGLEVALQQLKAENPDVQLGIRADATLPYQKVITIIDAAKRAGISQVGLVNTPER